MKNLASALILFALVGCDQPMRNEKPTTVSPKMESIIKITSEQLGVSAESIRPDSTFASLGADDLDFVEIVMATEDAHKVSIPDELLTKIAGISAAEEIVHHLTIAGFAQALDSAVPQTESEPDENVVTGLYAELVTKPLPEGYSYLFMPSLAAILTAAENKEGRPLTEKEVLSIRDKVPSMVAPNDVILKMNESRQYQDIDPKSVWTEWQALRAIPN
jgi:acyl carrier protein